MDKLKRQKFRDYFQPSRILIAIAWDNAKEIYVPITLCFDMYGSYKPNSICFAIQNINYSYKLYKKGTLATLAIPTEDLVDETMYFGEASAKKTDKIKDTNLKLKFTKYHQTPLVQKALSNIIIKVSRVVNNGDHKLIIGEVLEFLVNTKNKKRNLVSLSRNDTEGYRILKQKGIHTIGVINK